MFTFPMTMFGSSGPSYTANAVDFNATTNYLSKGSGFTGAADSQTGILSCWVKLNGSDGSSLRIIAGDTSSTIHISIRRTVTNRFQITADNAAGSTILDLRSTSSYATSTTWLNLLASWDLSTTTTNLYVNNVSDKNAVTVTNDTIKYTLGAWGIGADSTGNDLLDACLAEVYFAPGQYLDFSNSANRAKFISGGVPGDLGSDGSTPTSTAPLLYLKNAAATVNTNSGTGGILTKHGTFSDCTTHP